MKLRTVAMIAAYLSVLVLGVAGAFYFGLQPKSVPKIKLSHFQTHDELSRAVISRLRLELKDAQFLALGFGPTDSQSKEILLSLYKALQEDQELKYQFVLIEPELGLSENFTPATAISLRDHAAQISEQVKQFPGTRILYIGPSIYTSQLSQESPAKQMFAKYGIVITSLSISAFPRNREQESQFPIQCYTQDTTGSGLLGCAVMSKSRLSYRKDKKHDLYAGMLDLVGGTDYLLLIAPPIK